MLDGECSMFVFATVPRPPAPPTLRFHLAFKVQSSRFKVRGSPFFATVPRPPASPPLQSQNSRRSLPFSTLHSSLFILHFPEGGRRVGRGRPEPLAPGRTSGPVGPQWLCPQRGIPPSPTRSERDQIQSVRARGRGALLAAERSSRPPPPFEWGPGCYC